MEKENVRYRR